MEITKKTKIIATIGPATSDVDILSKMRLNGMNIARINFSHSDYEKATPTLKNIQKAEKISGKKIAILQDLSGPKIRTGDFENGETTLKKNSIIEINNEKNFLGNEKNFSISYPKLFKDLKSGERIFLNDGKQELKVLSLGKKTIKTKVIIGGKIRSKRGVNLPDSDISISSLTKKDKEDLKFTIDFDVDFVAMSFVKNTKDLKELRQILNKKKSKAMIVAKIETPSAVKNFDQILKECDAVMVARGDLAVEIQAHKVPKIQKEIIKKCNQASKPVIVATQMLESMIYSPVPTRAEVSDVYNAISDGADAVMLSEETAMGKYPLKTIQVMSNISKEAEDSIDYSEFSNIKYYENIESEKISTDNAISRYCVKAAQDLDVKAIVVLTESGITSRNISRYKSTKKIYVFSSREKTLRQNSISFGTKSAGLIDLKNINDAIYFSKKWLIKNKIVKKNDRVALVAGIPFKKVGGTNTLTIFEI